jgi:outer membrane protein OmpA-like peptidoglycan-associated protein
MADIPVERKKALPVWLLPLIGLAVLGLALFIWQYAGKSDNRAVVPAPTDTVGPAAGAVAGAKACSGDAECADKQLCLAAACTDIKAGLAECASVNVHFDTASAEIRDSDKPAIVRMSRCLNADQAMKLTIEGTADERGPADKNYELGEKRAMSVARALTQQGVKGEQLKVVSYGDSYQLCGDSDAECWAKNRQAALKPK